MFEIRIFYCHLSTINKTNCSLHDFVFGFFIIFIGKNISPRQSKRNAFLMNERALSIFNQKPNKYKINGGKFSFLRK